jgi:hypothetical protein
MSQNTQKGQATLNVVHNPVPPNSKTIIDILPDISHNITTKASPSPNKSVAKLN